MVYIHTTRPQFREQAIPLFSPAPYKVMKGGRGAAKSWDFVRAMLTLGANRKLFVLCAREIQLSIKESVKKLIDDQIDLMGFGEHVNAEGVFIPAFYESFDQEIRGINGTRIVFAGIRNEIRKIKSYEGVDLCLIFEADKIPETSWTILLPTIRRDAPYGPFGQGSEIWIEFNPELTSDYTYKYWVVDPPQGAVVITVNWMDNPWFPETLERQRLEMLKKNPDEYRTVWGGHTRKTLAGAIYAKEMEKAINDGRVIPNIKYIKGRGVTVSVDLGRADMTSLLFWQQVGTEHNLFDFYENCGFDWSHYQEHIQGTGYVIKGLWLPHDAKAKVIQAKKSIEQQARDAYPQPGVVKIVPGPYSDTLGINAVRQLFPRVNINETACAGCILSIQHYQYGVNPLTKQRTKVPLHNWASHACKGLEYYALQLTEGDKKERSEAEDGEHSRVPDHHPQGWMQ